jgi:hypothetical protein
MLYQHDDNCSKKVIVKTEEPKTSEKVSNMTTFALRGNTEKQIHGSHSQSPIECRGAFRMQGPQPVSALPEWLVELFENSDIQQISLSTRDYGVVYTRIPEPE